MERNTVEESPPRATSPGGKLKEWRTAKGLTLGELASKLELGSASIVCEYEKGRRRPSFASATAIQRVTRGVVRVEEWGINPKTGRRVAA